MCWKGCEVAAQPGPLTLVPRRRVIKFCLRGRTEYQRQAHGFNRDSACALTCSQGTTSSGLASSSATRLSSSRRWASVSSGWYGSAAVVAQISWTRAIRWSRGS